MARYIGPKSRIARKFGEAIFGPDKVLSKKNYPPGQHGQSRRKKRRNMVFSYAKNKKPNILMAFWKNNSVTFTKKLRANRV